MIIGVFMIKIVSIIVQSVVYPNSHVGTLGSSSCADIRIAI